jgi:hypothetical protein
MNELRFAVPVALPPSCVRCGEPATKARPIRAIEGFNIIVFRYRRWMWAIVPLCQPCARRRALGSWLLAPAAILLGLGLPIAATFAASSDLISSSVQLLFVFIGLTWFVLYINFGEQWFDYWLLGVRGVRFTEKPATITLRFRDDGRANQIAMLCRPQIVV